MINRVSLAELESAQIRLRPAEAVALVSEICRQNLARILPGIPSPAVIRLLRDGGIAIEGPVRAAHDDVARAATLLSDLLPGFEAPPEYRASGALRLLIARALGTLDLPPFASLEDFTAALSRFTTLDARETAAALFSAWEDAMETTSVADAASEAEIPSDPDLAHRPLMLTAAIEPERRSGSRWVWAASSAALIAASAFGGWHWADARLARHSPPPTVIERAPQPAEPAAPAPLPAAVADAAPLRNPSPRVVRASAFSPSFGSDSALYFHEQQGDASVLKVAHTTRSGEIAEVSSIVEDRARNFHVRPSPDGSRIAFDSDRDGTRGIFVAATDGSGAVRISGPGYAAVPSWSPDGTRLAFVRAEADAPRVWNLWTSAPDGSQIQRRTHHTVGQAWGASWFPDGLRVAYSVETRLVILDLQSGRTTTYRSPVPGRLLRTPAVSPDGRRIIFQIHREGVWVLDVRTGTTEFVLDDPTAEEFTWAPDGRRVAFHSRRSGQWSVWMMVP